MTRKGVLIVSADPDASDRMRRICEGNLSFEGSVASGAECLARLARAGSSDIGAIVVDCVLPDISPLNMVGSLTSEHPGIGVILALTPLDDRLRDTAMLAGARAIVERTAIEAELLPAIQRVLASTPSVAVPAQRDTAPDRGSAGRVMSIVGAKGGCGRSTLAVGLAAAARELGLDVALLDLDVQFGDLTFLFDVKAKRSLVDLVRDLESGLDSVRAYASQVAEGLSVYAAPPKPEQAEIVAPRVSLILGQLRREHDLIIVNTGAFWTLLHAELIDASDLTVFVTLPTAVSLKATVLAREMCSRLGIAESHLAFALNRVTGAGDTVSPDDARSVLGARLAVSIAEDPHLGRQADAGQLLTYATGNNSFHAACSTALQQLAVAAGIRLPTLEQAAPAPRRGLFRR